MSGNDQKKKEEECKMSLRETYLTISYKALLIENTMSNVNIGNWHRLNCYKFHNCVEIRLDSELEGNLIL